MAEFRKRIIRPGKFLVKVPGTNQRKVKEFDKDYIREAYLTNTKMLEEGMLIPAPYGHSDGNKLIPVPLLSDPDSPEKFLDATSKKASRWDHAMNSGFWKRFDFDEKTGELFGVLEADGDENDPNSHAGRIGKTFRSVSPFILDEWVDGFGNTRPKAILHVAITNRPVDGTQPNFIQEGSNPLTALAMSFCDDDFLGAAGSMMGDDESNDDEKKPKKSESNDDSSTPQEKSDISVENSCNNAGYSAKIMEVLGSKLGLVLPEDTSDQNILERLLIVLSNLPDKSGPTETTEGLPKKPPEDAEVPSQAIMSNETNDNPKAVAILAELTTTRKSRMKDKINSLVRAGKIGRAYADSTLVPMVDAFAMSLDDMDESGAFPVSAIELSLDILENNDSLVTSAKDGKPPKGAEMATEPEDMNDHNEQASQEDIDAELARLFPR